MDQKLAEGPPTKPRNEQFQCDKSRGMRFLVINDPEKIRCSKVPKICWYPGVVEVCQDEGTPCEVV